MPRTAQELTARVIGLQSLLAPTPIRVLDLPGLRVHAKLEFTNAFGSLKDRSAYWVLRRAIERGDVVPGGYVIESSSGNFASALAGYCRLLGLRFIAVIDPNITGAYEAFLRRTCHDVVKVELRDDTGGYLKTRLAQVAALVRDLPQAYWPNQYENPDAAEAHYLFTGRELVSAVPNLDHVFVGVSTGGTIAGVSRRVREACPRARIVAVDTVGSVIFGGPPRPRKIPGIGASISPALVSLAAIDEVVMVPEAEAARGCRRLLEEHGLFVGGSTGSVFAGILDYFSRTGGSEHPREVAFLCADGGSAYLNTVFNEAWVEQLSG